MDEEALRGYATAHSHSSVCSFVRSFIYLFIYLFICVHIAVSVGVIRVSVVIL